MGWNRVAHPTEGSPRRGLHGVPAILCGVNAVKDARRLLYLSKLHAEVVSLLTQLAARAVHTSLRLTP